MTNWFWSTCTKSGKTILTSPTRCRLDPCLGSATFRVERRTRRNWSRWSSSRRSSSWPGRPSRRRTDFRTVAPSAFSERRRGIMKTSVTVWWTPHLTTTDGRGIMKTSVTVWWTRHARRHTLTAPEDLAPRRNLTLWRHRRRTSTIPSSAAATTTPKLTTTTTWTASRVTTAILPEVRPPT